MQKFKKIENITIDEENKKFKMDKVVETAQLILSTLDLITHHKG